MAGKALITGGAGFIGSHLAELLLGEGWEVFALDDLSTGSHQNVAQLKEKAGVAKGDPGLAESGRRDQIKGNLKASGKKLKDAANNL